MTFRGFLYALAKLLGDVNAVARSSRTRSSRPIERRIARRIAGKVTGRAMRRLFG